MISYDEQITKNLKEINKIHEDYKQLASALKVVNKTSDKTYGLSVGFLPKKGIYCIKDGWVKLLDSGDNSIDDIEKFELIDRKDGKMLKITYKNSECLSIK
ncbi:hypothetical protein Halha_0276 [Halobacteroides halobius DSM 5150]|uniref:Uncharacterized protein n=1 Tax=Halobacteroides halobius (strain ATCC 35273 / DSM 5150 / MD-1) TaxID=748449 RepID=L0K4W5_HALHC|nr:hypothetical protein [Halobacteroides halobius]AGB40287.1 hypothetical protein Halha_0276 [Halobacteroides halobius DSM 5150]